jgi:hypothetical protein
MVSCPHKRPPIKQAIISNKQANASLVSPKHQNADPKSRTKQQQHMQTAKKQSEIELNIYMPPTVL